MGCGRAHDDMGKPGVNITYEDVKRAADANGKTVDETLDTIAQTADADRGDTRRSTPPDSAPRVTRRRHVQPAFS